MLRKDLKMITNNTGQIVAGNVLLVICCIFYLLWWIIAFKPEGAIKGMRSGWLLLPAAAFGVGAIILLVRSFHLPEGSIPLFKNMWIVAFGVVIYIALLVLTSIVFHRVVTTELILIVGWVVLAICEINTLFVFGRADRVSAWALIVIAFIAGIVSFICYMKYYDLDARKGWVCGMIPLILVMVMMLALTAVALKHTENRAADTDIKEGVLEMKVTSANLHDGVWDTDITNTKNGRNVSPELTWEAVNGAGEYAVYMLDPSAGNWLHWRAHGLMQTHLDEGADISENEYIGPYPPSGTHTYIVYVFALKTAADSYPGLFDSRNSGIESIISGLDKAGGQSGNIIAQGSISGTYTAGK